MSDSKSAAAPQEPQVTAKTVTVTVRLDFFGQDLGEHTFALDAKTGASWEAFEAMARDVIAGKLTSADDRLLARNGQAWMLWQMREQAASDDYLPREPPQEMLQSGGSFQLLNRGPSLFKPDYASTMDSQELARFNHKYSPLFVLEREAASREAAGAVLQREAAVVAAAKAAAEEMAACGSAARFAHAAAERFAASGQAISDQKEPSQKASFAAAASVLNRLKLELADMLLLQDELAKRAIAKKAEIAAHQDKQKLATSPFASLAFAASITSNHAELLNQLKLELTDIVLRQDDLVKNAVVLKKAEIAAAQEK